MARNANPHQLAAENKDLRARLERAEESVREILNGKSDAVFVQGADTGQLFTLKDADHSYRTLIENMSEGALTLTPEGLILYANRRFAQMLGAPLEKVIGSEIHTWIAPESRQALQMLLQKDAVANRSEELVLVAADGTDVQVHLSVSRLLLDKMPDSFCMIATDLTEQKRNETILAAEEFARAILEQAADAIVICDRTGRIIRASKQAQAFCGKNPVGRPFENHLIFYRYLLSHSETLDLANFIQVSFDLRVSTVVQNLVAKNQSIRPAAVYIFLVIKNLVKW